MGFRTVLFDQHAAEVITACELSSAEIGDDVHPVVGRAVERRTRANSAEVHEFFDPHVGRRKPSTLGFLLVKR